MENILHTGVIGGACTYWSKPLSLQHGAAGRLCEVVPTRRAGISGASSRLLGPKEQLDTGGAQRKFGVDHITG